VDHADDPRVGAVHTRRNASLQRLETRQYHLLPLYHIHVQTYATISNKLRFLQGLLAPTGLFRVI